ncbi:MAG TPA: diguanylate cyclase [Myxococcota bacterium]|jgi:diguanylate cyclase (GGDEF)-like protein
MPESTSPLSKQPFNSLATKLILFVFVSTLATALVVSWISIQSTHDYLSLQMRRQYPAALANAGEVVLGWLVAGQEELTGLKALTGDGAARRASPRSAAAPVPVGEPLARAQRRSKYFDAFALLSADGSVRQVVGAAEPLVPGTRLPLTGIDRTVLRWLPQGAAPQLVAATPFPVDADGTGSLIGLFKAERIPSLLAGQRPVSGAEIAIVDAEGRVIARSDASPTPGLVPLARLLASGPGQVVQYLSADGVHFVGAAHPLGLFDWQVSVEVPFEVAFAPMLSVVMRVFLVDLCIILLLSYLAYRITTAAVRPIEALSEAARRIAQGQFDLEIPEPSTHDEIGLLTRTFNDMMRKLRGYQTEIETANRILMERNGDLQRANEVLNQLSITDGLTKLHNHRYFQDALTREIKRVNRANEPLAMLLIDLDDFKSLNDRLGHAAGDELLLRVARTMNDVVRESDLLARYGGEEFVVLASNTNLLGAYRLAEKLRTTVAEQSQILGDSMRPTRVTISIGVAEFRGNRHKFFSAADQALYRAKASGKNCVMVDDEQALHSALEPPAED